MPSQTVKPAKAKRAKFRIEFWKKHQIEDWSLDELRFMRDHYMKTFDLINKLINEKESANDVY